MNFVNQLKEDKNKRDKFLAKIGKYSFVIKTVANMVNLSSRAFVPIWMLVSLLHSKHPSKIISLYRLIRDELQGKIADYAKWMGAQKTDSDGFIESERCDALLFSSLVSSTEYWKSTITKARDENGMWHRRPTHRPCYPEGSKSTISRDMFVGLFWYIWRNQRLDIAEDLWAYGKKNSWIMGQGDVSRIYLTPGLQATLAEIIYQLGGDNYKISRNLPQSFPLGLEGYECHLQVLHILLRGELKGFITGPMKESLDEMSSRHPKNHLFSVAVARYAHSQNAANFIASTAAIGLEDINLWPRDRLPNNLDRSSRWLFENNVLTPGSDPNEVHTGGDLVFCGSLIMDYSDTID